MEKKGKKKRKKIMNWEIKAKHEKILIMVLIPTIVVLALVLGYGIYDSFETKAETEKETNYLNSAVILLNEEKSQLISERDALDQAIILLTQQTEQLTTENSGLTSELATLQADYDTCSASLQRTKDNLEDCESSP